MYKSVLLLTLLSCSTTNDIMPSDYQSLSKFLPKAIKEREDFENEMGQPFGGNQEDQFLHTIQGVESSFGSDTEHPVISGGIHKGDSAIGKYALMPNTIQELARKVSNPSTQLGGTLPYKLNTDDLKALGGLSKEQLKQTIEADPALQDRLARYLAQDIGLRSSNEQEKAYRWNMGQNIPKGSITPDKLDRSEYVQKFNKLRARLSRR